MPPVLGLTVALVVIGTVTFARLEGWGWLDALYATIITITTVGYGDLSPQTPKGRLFAIFFTFIAIGVAGYAISTFAAYLIESREEKKAKYLRKRRMKRIDALDNHYIVCGADLVGTSIAEEFQQAGVPYVIIDAEESRLKTALLYSHPDYFRQKVRSLKDIVEVDLSEYEERTIAELAEMLDSAYILDDPTDDSVLVRAAIGRAAGLVAAMPDERDNLAIVVGARALAKRFENTGLRIMARIEDSRYMRKMYLSGADYVRIPAVMSGFEMANHMITPVVGQWWHMLNNASKQAAPSRVQQIALATKPEWVGSTISQLHQQAQVLIVGVKRDDAFITPPAADLTLQADDIAITLSQTNLLSA